QFLDALATDSFIAVASREINIGLFGDEVIDLDGVEGRNGGQFAGRRADQITDLALGDPGNAVNRRDDASEFEVELGLFYGGFGGGHGGFGGEVGVDGIVEFLLADGAGFGEGSEAFD